MHRLFVAGAIISTALVFHSQLNAADTQNQTTIENKAENPVLSKAFEETKKTFLEIKPSTATTQMIVKELPMHPVDKNINNFPAAPQENETNPENLQQYYLSVAQAYENEATKLYESTLRAHESKNRNQNKTRLNSYRSENVKYVNDFTTDKAKASQGASQAPFKSSKHIPSTIRRDSQVYQNKQFRESQTKYEQLNIKSKFYLALANAIATQSTQ